jgi:hypothetical protein
VGITEKTIPFHSIPSFKKIFNATKGGNTNGFLLYVYLFVCYLRLQPGIDLGFGASGVGGQGSQNSGGGEGRGGIGETSGEGLRKELTPRVTLVVGSSRDLRRGTCG